MPNQASATARALASDLVSRLARYFPDAMAVRIPIRLSRAHENDNSKGGAPSDAWDALQETVIEFSTPQEVLFATSQPLEFADHVLIESRDGSHCAEASVVAVQYYADRTVVGARFVKPVPNWIVKS